MAMLEHAISYAEKGWRVLPLRVQGKAPLGSLVFHGCKDATTDIDIISDWWATEPRANIGIACGPESNLVVIDVDIEKGGAESLADLVKAYGKFKTIASKTGTGGFHFLFEYPEQHEIHNKCNWIPGVDIRGDGGYIVAPPSIHPNSHRYQWCSEDPLGPLPAAIMAQLEHIIDIPMPSMAGTGIKLDLTKRGQEFIFMGVQTPGRNGRLFEAACEMKAAGYDLSEAIAKCRAGAALCRPPLDDDKGNVRQVKNAFAEPKSIQLPEPNYGADYSVMVQRLRVDEEEPETPSSDPEDIKPQIDAKEVLEVTTGPLVTNLDEVELLPIEWLWHNRIARGTVTLLCGNPGVGKSWLTQWLASAVTTGRPWPDDDDQKPRDVGSVMMVTCEDDLARVMVPRIAKMGGDLRKIQRLEGIAVYGNKSWFSIKDHLSYLKDATDKQSERTGRTSLLVIDPLGAYMNKTDTHKHSDVYSTLSPLAEFAETTGIAVVLVQHLTKAKTSSAIERQMGSVAFTGLARNSWYIVQNQAQDRENASDSAPVNNPYDRMFLHGKSNLVPLQPGLSFAIDEDGLQWSDGQLNIDADEAFAMEASESEQDSTALDDAKEFLTRWVGPEGHDSKELTQRAEAEGHSAMTLKRARKELNLVAEKVKNEKGRVTGWIVRRPEGVECG